MSSRDRAASFVRGAILAPLFLLNYFYFCKKVGRGGAKVYRSDEGITLETSAFLPFTVANLCFQLSC